MSPFNLYSKDRGQITAPGEFWDIGKGGSRVFVFPVDVVAS